MGSDEFKTAAEKISYWSGVKKLSSLGSSGLVITSALAGSVVAPVVMFGLAAMVLVADHRIKAIGRGQHPKISPVPPPKAGINHSRLMPNSQ